MDLIWKFKTDIHWYQFYIGTPVVFILNYIHNIEVGSYQACSPSYFFNNAVVKNMIFEFFKYLYLYT